MFAFRSFVFGTLKHGGFTRQYFNNRSVAGLVFATTRHCDGQPPLVCPLQSFFSPLLEIRVSNVCKEIAIHPSATHPLPSMFVAILCGTALGQACLANWADWAQGTR